MCHTMAKNRFSVRVGTLTVSVTDDMEIIAKCLKNFAITSPDVDIW